MESARHSAASLAAHAKGRSNFFVEADRGTMTIKRFTLKLKAYAAFSVAGKHKEKFGINKFRVLTVTSSKARCKNLIDAALAADDVRELRTRFLFATEEDLTLSVPESVLNKIWTAPGGEKNHVPFSRPGPQIQEKEVHGRRSGRTSVAA
jgi:hypothetical protein